MNEDFQDMLAALLASGARFLVVGAHALAVHGVPRATGDLDVWVLADPVNAKRVWAALERFGAPVDALGATPGDLARPGVVLQIGLPPRRIDILTDLTGVDFESAWRTRVVHRIGSLEVPFVDRETFIRNKRATGRLRDLADVERLEEEGG
ncbi:MAG TPA: hypothetical protein VHF87_08550 [Methylomirabilota bacterium]|nr:hypothetical protein [Methylomirabilota bacterium]